MIGNFAALFAPLLQAARLAAWPVGSIYMSMQATSPATLFGGTWVRLENRFLLGAGSGYAAGATGGEAAHQLTASEMPSHSHTLDQYPTWPTQSDTGKEWHVTYTRTPNGLYTNWKTSAGNTGSGAAHNNMPPYLAVYMWRRTA